MRKGKVRRPLAVPVERAEGRGPRADSGCRPSPPPPAPPPPRLPPPRPRPARSPPRTERSTQRARQPGSGFSFIGDPGALPRRPPPAGSRPRSVQGRLLRRQDLIGVSQGWPALKPGPQNRLQEAADETRPGPGGPSGASCRDSQVRARGGGGRDAGDPRPPGGPASSRRQRGLGFTPTPSPLRTRGAPGDRSGGLGAELWVRAWAVVLTRPAGRARGTTAGRRGPLRTWSRTCCFPCPARCPPPAQVRISPGVGGAHG